MQKNGQSDKGRALSKNCPKKIERNGKRQENLLQGGD